MPSKYSIKEYEPGAYYHIFNRGVEKRIVFQDEADYKTFLGYLHLYLTDPHLSGDSRKTRPPSLPIKNYTGNITLLAYCLMPNHFHLFVHQDQIDGINHFMRSLMSEYVRYFNKKYNRVGSLFQGPYKAVKITSETQWVYLSKYIHRNPLPISPFRESPERLCEYKYSSYQNYLGQFKQSWVSTSDILSHFSGSSKKYQQFVETGDDITPIYKVALDYD
jgi:putative transposase